MSSTSRAITGTVMFLLGVFLSGLPFFSTAPYFLLFYGIPILIIGIVIFFNAGEDIIEGVKK